MSTPLFWVLLLLSGNPTEIKMKNRVLFFALFVYFGGFTQIQELQKAQDARKQVIGEPAAGKKTVFDPCKYVNPFIGTGGHGHTFPGASIPFGMIQLSPDTRHDGWDGCSGYHYSDSIIYGFSHTHLSGTGVPDYCDLLVVPQSGVPKIDPGYLVPNGYGDSFGHSRESASPGDYRVHLNKQNIDVQLSVSQRSGFHRYTFNKAKGKKFILLDLDHRDKLIASNFEVVDKTTIKGKRISQAWAQEQHFYFFLQLDTPYQKVKIFDKDGRHKLLLTFPANTKEINIKVGISAVNEAGAELNLKTEIPHWDLNKTRIEAAHLWRLELDKTYFFAQEEQVMTNFYTALYHAYLAPNLFNDTDERYRGRDNKIHQLGIGNHTVEQQFTVFSLWDTYRATHPLFNLTQTERTKDFIGTFLRQNKEGGDLPVWELAGNETECMIGYHSVSVMADAMLKGNNKYNTWETIAAMIHTAELDEYAKKSFATNGFISAAEEPESVSKTLEYSYDDFCIANAIRNADDYMTYKDSSVLNKLSEFDRRSFGFVNLFDPSTKYMRARRSGLWFTPFNPAEVNFNYTEANSWQYSLYAPHAVGLLRNLIGGKDSLELWLDRLFTADSDLAGRHQVDITGLIGQYAHGNEPSHHMAYLYNYTNNPSKTQLYTDSILYNLYSNQPDGLSGNEDCGQMSSWYVLSAMGLYPIAPGTLYYEFGRPLAEEVRIKISTSNSLLIKTVNNSKKNKYIKRITLNGKDYNKSYIGHWDLINGGALTFYMTSDSTEAYRPTEHAPTLNTWSEGFCPVPFFTQGQRVFEEKQTIALDVIGSDSIQVFYTTDGSDPLTSTTAAKYSKAFEINKTTTIKAYAVGKTAKSTLIENTFVLKDNTVSIQIASKYSDQYAASGDFTLIDGIIGTSEYRTGDWQGYWDQDLNFSVSFDQPRNIDQIELGFLSDMKSWIFLPSSLNVEISEDGVNFEALNLLSFTPESSADMAPHRVSKSLKVNRIRPIKAVRILAAPVSTCPEWHLGQGNPTWLFVDEISFK